MTDYIKSNWFVIPSPNPDAQVRLFCFSYAGGSAASYISWASSLPGFVELICIQLPGRGTRLFEPPCSTMDELIPALSAQVMPLLTKPYAFFGHSLGGRVAFELILALKESGKPEPAHFFISASRAAHLVGSSDPIHHLDDQGFITGLRRLNGTPETVLQDAELMDLLMPMLRADFGISETYISTNTALLGCDYTLLSGTEDQMIHVDLISPWHKHFSSDGALISLPGNHFYVDEEPEQLTRIIAETLEKSITIPDSQNN